MFSEGKKHIACLCLLSSNSYSMTKKCMSDNMLKFHLCHIHSYLVSLHIHINVYNLFVLVTLAFKYIFIIHENMVTFFQVVFILSIFVMTEDKCHIQPNRRHLSMQDDPTLQSSVSKKILVYYMFNFARNYKLALHFPDELQRNFHLVYG